MPFQAAGKIEFKQNQKDLRGRKAAFGDQIVGLSGRWSQEREDAGAGILVRGRCHGVGRFEQIGPRGDASILFHHWFKSFHNIVDIGDQRGAIANQSIRALRARVERRAGHREHDTSHFGRQPR